MKYVLTLKNLTKRYKRSAVNALDGISLSVQPKEVYGFLGSNGAGKSTTIRLLLDFIRPTSGTARIRGVLANGPESYKLKNDIGYLAGDVVLQSGVTARKLLNYLGSLHGDIDASYLSTLVRRFDAQLDVPVQTLSKGNRQKIGIIQAFMHKPKVLILDEPTSGLDPVMQENFYKTILEAKEWGAAVFLSSHSIAEVEKICDRIAIIRKGSIVFEGSIDDIRKTRAPVWLVTLSSKKELSKLKSHDSFEVLSLVGETARVQLNTTISAALSDLSTYNVTHLETEHIDAEDAFMQYYNEEVSA